MSATDHPPELRPVVHVNAGALACKVRVRVETPADRIRDLERRLAATEHLPRTRDAWNRGIN